eukprot:NODE_1002_length_1176_cov_236.712511_g762_i0.p1 GENE.NODE_1002_length_1176_cov_236.712511_g762_i0~~NODE_1002_length_1176_cov_236.712511_g762_i0.p1  ORF type:complete len:217 (-),score=34.82 NODE_1002_length_1176_cov_236.712511_g762_i0:424-1074(-)
MPSGLPYLHPSQRNLKSEQIGPSSHKNNFSIGVLDGNWVEDREAFTQTYVHAPSENTTVSRASYQHPGGKAGTKPHRVDPITAGSLPRQLLFGHGNDFNQTSYCTMNELFYSNPNPDSGSQRVKTDVAVKMSAASGRKDMLEKKKAQWQEDAAGDMKQFETMNSQMIDATGKQLQENYSFQKPTTNKWGTSVKELSSSHHRTGLRGEFALNRTPLR